MTSRTIGASADEQPVWPSSPICARSRRVRLAFLVNVYFILLRVGGCLVLLVGAGNLRVVTVGTCALVAVTREKSHVPL